jgi:tRNA-specific 2-thiouridylase
LLRGVDPSKDQSYVLFGIARERLERMLLPVGGYLKEEIRQLAAQLHWPIADKPDSQEICFVERGRHAEFIAQRRDGADTSGELVLTNGRVVGRHTGLQRFTIGQRKGLGVALGQPHYVVRIERDSRRVILGTLDERACRQLTADGCNWLVDPAAEPFRCRVQFRYQSAAVPAMVTVLDTRRMRVEFDEPCFGVAPGQAAVCYDDQRVLGGGWIQTTAT